MKFWRSLLLMVIAASFILGISSLSSALDSRCVPRPADWLSNWGKWGPNDEVGALNYITPQVIKDAAKLIKQGKVISLAMNNIPGKSPKWPGRHGLIRDMAVDGADFLVAKPFGEAGWTESNIIVEDHGSTHQDPLVHVWWGLCTYNGYYAPEIISRFKGVTKGSTNAYLPKSFTRGVLIDVAKYLKVDYVDKIDGAYALTPELIEKIAKAENVKITPGTALLIRTGWVKKWTGTKTPWGLGNGEVGISCGIEKWLQEKKVAFVGADNVAVEAIPASKECNNFYKIPLVPMHIGVLSNMGVPFMELADLEELSADSAKDGVYEFAFSFAPFRYYNASGGLTSPTAIK